MESSESSSSSSPVWQWPARLLSSILTKLQELVRAWLLWIVSAGPIPSHIAFIMDGNRRFADRLHVDRHIGHSYGYDTLLRTLKDCFDLHIKIVTLFAFSIDNFKRSSVEVSALMDLMQSKLEALIEKEGLASKYGVQVRILGDLSLLPHGARTAAEKAMAVTSKNNSYVLNLCISYTSTHEMAQSVQQTCRNVSNALGNDCRFNGDLVSGIKVTCGCKGWDVPTALSSHMSKCSCEPDHNSIDTDGLSELSNSKPDHNCIDTDGLSELSNSKLLNGIEKSLHAELKEEGYGGHDGEENNSDLVPAQLKEGNGGHDGEENNSDLVPAQLKEGNGGLNGAGNNSDLDPGNVHQSIVGEIHRTHACGENCPTDDRILKLVEEFVSESEIEKHLYTGPSCPPPDLLIRTSKETRLSNFLLWQASFSHLEFCKVLWPEFSFRHLILIILEYQRSLPTLQRKRRNHNTASVREISTGYPSDIIIAAPNVAED